MLRSPWDYAPRRDEFVAWASRVPRLANPAAVAAWNTDKVYLRQLALAGVPVVPTTWVPPGAPWSPPSSGEYVIKPAVSAGSIDTGRYKPGQQDLAQAHLRRLGESGRLAMVQPYQSAVDTYGETALLFTPDPATGELAFSHAIRKGPMLSGPHLGVDEQLYLSEEITTRQPTPAEHKVARQALAAIPFNTRDLLYARIDLIPGPDGEPLLIELELTEPSLFLGTHPTAAPRLATAIATRLPSPG